MRTPEENRAHVKAWKLANPEKYKALLRRNASHSAKNVAKVVAWRKANPEKLKAQRAKYRAKKPARYASDPIYRLRELLRNRLSAALRNKSKKGSAIKLLGCTAEEAICHIEAQFLPGMTWSNQGKWHIDHIKPLASFDLEDPEQLAIVCHYTNLQPLWAGDNLSKGART